LPVLVESRTGGAWLAWTSDASEYEMAGLPAGAFRARALDLFGRVTFASGATVRDGSTAEPARLWAKVDLDEPDSREVMGFVRWESGVPAAKAAVFMQNSYNFRKFVRRVESDEHGYFRFPDVPGGEPYFVFALPPGENNAMRRFAYFRVGTGQREVWQALQLHPHRVTGDMTDAASATPVRRGFPGARTVAAVTVASVRRGSLDPAGTADRRPPAQASTAGLVMLESPLQLVRIEGKAERVVWTFRAEPSGKFLVANVPHGRYCVQVLGTEGGKAVRCLPFDVGDGGIETTVRWSSP